MMSVRKLNQVFNFTFSTAFGVSNITSNLDLAVKILNTVRKKDQEFIRPGAVSVRPNEMVVQFDERLADFLF